MQQRGFFGPRAAAAALCIALLLTAQQASAGPLAPQARGGAESSVPAPPRRAARMTPLWRIMNSKPLGAYCQNNYECSTGLCRAGHCSTFGPVTY